MCVVPLHTTTWISAEDVLHFADLGFEQISVEPVVAADRRAYAIKEEDLPQIFAEYDRLAAEYGQETQRKEEASRSSTL